MSGTRRDKAFDMRIKLLMIGDSGVGKTSLLLRYASDSFAGTFITTIGIDFKLKSINLDGTQVKLQIWDTAGQERFRTITVAYFRGAHGILLVYDVTDEKSFRSIENWIKDIAKHADANINKILVGNKADDPNRTVTFEEGKALADQYGMEFFETSAKTGSNVEDAYLCIARQCKNRLMSSDTPAVSGGGVAGTGTVNVNQETIADDKKKSSCC